MPVVHERRERADHEQRRPEVVARERHRADQERRDSDQGERTPTRARDCGDDEAADAERGHQPAEGLRVVRVAVEVVVLKRVEALRVQILLREVDDLVVLRAAVDHVVFGEEIDRDLRVPEGVVECLAFVVVQREREVVDAGD